MALVKCKECGREISKKAEVCPHCGYKIKKKHGCLTQIALLVFGVVIFAVFLPMFKGDDHEPYTGYEPTGETPVIEEPKVDKDGGYDVTSLEDRCFAEIKQWANHPSTVKTHRLTGTAGKYFAEDDTYIISTDFEAKNSFGLELKFTALCGFNREKLTNFVVREKK